MEIQIAPLCDLKSGDSASYLGVEPQIVYSEVVEGDRRCELGRGVIVEMSVWLATSRVVPAVAMVGLVMETNLEVGGGGVRGLRGSG